MRIRTAKALVLVCGLMPALVLAARSLAHTLGDDPIQAITYETGDWAMLLLAATLAITPLRRATGAHSLISFRRMLGLLAFFYASLHCLTYFWLAMRGRAIFTDVARRPFIAAGIAAFVMMIPLAITSNAASIRRLGSRWRELHQLVYVLAIAAVAHYVWMRPGEAKPYLYLVIFSGLLLSRVPMRKSLRATPSLHD